MFTVDKPILYRPLLCLYFQSPLRPKYLLLSTHITRHVPWHSHSSPPRMAAARCSSCRATVEDLWRKERLWSVSIHSLRLAMYEPASSGGCLSVWPIRVADGKWSLNHIARRDSTKQNCFVELSRVGRCDHGLIKPSRGVFIAWSRRELTAAVLLDLGTIPLSFCCLLGKNYRSLIRWVWHFDTITNAPRIPRWHHPNFTLPKWRYLLELILMNSPRRQSCLESCKLEKVNYVS